MKQTSYNRRNDSDTTIVELDGDFIYPSLQTFREEFLNDIVTGNVKKLVLDFGKVPMIDSGGVGLLISILKNIEKHGGRLSILNPTSDVKNVLGILGLMAVLPIHMTSEESMKWIQAAN